MSIFGDLFGEEGEGGNASALGPGGRTDKGTIPYPPRPNSGLCGIYNQGATCYMNSLLQTLLYTPEFRDALFSLSQDVLGRLKDANKPHAKVRVIPIQLQRLFSRLLLLNQQGATTTDLTDSFGWTNNEELQQHDAQELNRILFSAIEDSLVGTPGQNLIRDLYHGSIVNQIICEECGRISEREEDFLDLSVAIAAGAGLQDVLHGNYVEMESLSGNNQYRCEACKKLVDAKKGARLRHLPPILTLSLLRFSFDFVKLERFKETGKFFYPLELDMADYCEKVSSAGDTEYELFSVVIHRGGAHGGHYFAYIRDIDGLGSWTHPDEEEIALPMDPSTGKVDFIEFDSPVELLQALLNQSGKDGMGIDKLCADLVKQTGVSWNKRFKRQYGPINKFLRRFDDIFLFDQTSNYVALKNPGQTTKAAGGSDDKDKSKKNTRPLSPPPDPAHAWFQFDDSRIHPIRSKDIEKQFSGKESAYMLFYRKKSWTRPTEASGNPSYNIPDWLLTEVAEQNSKIEQEREEYEVRVNTITAQVYASSLLKYERGALQARTDMCPYLEMKFDRRKTLQEFRRDICEMCGELISGSDYVIHLARDLPAGLHLYSKITEPDDCLVKDTLIENGSKLLIWDGEQINGEMDIPVGADYEPVLLKVTHGNPSQFSRGFPKNMTIAQLSEYISTVSQISVNTMVLTRLIAKGTESIPEKFGKDEASKTLAELGVVNGDHIIAEDARSPSSPATENAIVKCSKMISFVVENRYVVAESAELKVIPVEVERDVSVGELKAVVVSQLALLDIPDGGRLRIDDDNLGLKPPLHEEQSIESAGLTQGMRLVLEAGSAPAGTQVTLIFTQGHPGSDKDDMEVIVDLKLTVLECLTLMRNKAGLEGTDWHLRKTNWCGEAAEMLNDLDTTLDQCQLRNGEHLLLLEGQVPPKGFIKVTAYLYDSPHSPSAPEGAMSWITSGLAGLLGFSQSSDSPTEFPVKLGDLVINKEETLEDLKLQIQTLPMMAEMTLPTAEFMRLRLVEGKRLTTVLRGSAQTIQRLKVTSGSNLGVQVLQHEENLSASQIVLQLRQRVPGSRSFLPGEELVWDSGAGGGPTPLSLRHCVTERLGQAAEHTIIAKHLPDKYEWIVIKHVQHEQKSGGKGGKGGRKKSSGRTNIRQAPFHVKDGDTIGVKNTQNDKTEDFTSEEDLEGLKKLVEEAEEKKRRREEMKKMSGDILDLGGGNSSKQRREVGIKIHVGDFR